MEQVFKDRMELYHPHTPVQITDKALSVFQVTEPLLVVFIFGIHPEKGEGLLDFVDVCGIGSYPPYMKIARQRVSATKSGNGLQKTLQTISI